MEGLITEATGAISAVEPVLLAVGGAVIALAAVSLGIRWVKASFF